MVPARAVGRRPWEHVVSVRSACLRTCAILPYCCSPMLYDTSFGRTSSHIWATAAAADLRTWCGRDKSGSCGPHRLEIWQVTQNATERTVFQSWNIFLT